MPRVTRLLLVAVLCLSSGAGTLTQPIPVVPAGRAAETRAADQLLMPGGWQEVQSTASRIATFALAPAACTSRPPETQPDPERASMKAVAVLGADRTSFGKTDHVILHVTITNPTSHSFRVLRWFTPFYGVERPLFSVMRDGTPVAYLGKMVKRAAPTDKDYLTLKAGESITGDVDLSEHYDLSLPGTYDVTYDVTSVQLFAGDEGSRPGDGRLTSNALHLVIDGRSARAPGI